MSSIFVVPREGARVRQPERQSRVMPAEGAFVPDDAHYQRLIACGDVAVAPAPVKTKAKAKPEAGQAKPQTTSTETARGSRRGVSEG